MNNYPISRKSNIVVQEFENEILIYDLKINKAFCLNETSALVYQLCDGTHSIAEISRILSRKLHQPVTEDFVWLALDNFKRDNLLEQNEDFEIDFNGLTRRQVIRKIGLASMVVLPLIASVISPTAAMAQSGGNLPLLAACSTPSRCANGFCNVCSRGLCNGSQVCCVGSGSHGPSVILSSCYDAGLCSTSSVICCSGQATFTVTNCDGAPGNGSCVCK